MNSDGGQKRRMTPIYWNEPQWRRQMSRHSNDLAPLGLICIWRSSFNAVMLSTKSEFDESSFGIKLRGNLLVTETIHPEEIQWWRYLREYWLRCWGNVFLHGKGEKKGGGVKRSLPGRTVLRREGRLFHCALMQRYNMCTCVLMVLQTVVHLVQQHWLAEADQQGFDQEERIKHVLLREWR